MDVGEESRNSGVWRPNQRTLFAGRGRACNLSYGEQKIFQLCIRRLLGCQWGGCDGCRDNDE